MRPVDWERLLTEQRIPFIDSGANVKRGELAIQCPFCGSADPSKHMGLNLETGWWSCWRNRAQHSGKSPLRLLMKLLGVSYGKARELAGLGDDYVDPEGFDAMAARLMQRDKTEGRPEQTQRRFLHMDDGFVQITDRGRTRKFWNYLYRRGFDGDGEVDALCAKYGLMAGLHGGWTDRVVLPYVLNGELVTWTGRAIGPATIRYRDLNLDESLCAPKDTLYNHDAALDGGNALVVVEGPFDAIKLDYYGRDFGVRAVALSTNSIKETQVFMVQELSEKFDQTIVMLDNVTMLGIVDSMRMRQSLHGAKNLKIMPVPYGAKDAGELTPRQVINWARAFI
jgi:hypothetical protein